MASLIVDKATKVQSVAMAEVSVGRRKIDDIADMSQPTTLENIGAEPKYRPDVYDQQGGRRCRLALP